jgi:N,N'-diacetyllegionaminate synthase
MKQITIGGRSVGDGWPTFIIAEIGYNFTSLDEAKQSIDAAIDCGVDAVKFQTFKADTLASRFTEFPAEAGATNQYEEFKRYEMSAEVHEILFDYARRQGTIVFSTPSYFDDVELLERLNVPVYKIGSDDLTNLPLMKYVANKRKPVIFSSGMANIAEVDEAIGTLRGTGNEEIIVLQCVSNYPIRDHRVVNLRVIPNFRKAFDVLVGFSDHTMTPAASLGAIALGACVIEKHFTIDKNMPVPDAFFSADPLEMRALVKSVRELEAALGTGVKTPTPTEVEMRQETRKSVIARQDIAQGEVITQDKIIVKRPGIGIPPKLAHLVPGRRAKRALRMDEAITWEVLS